MSYDEPYDAVIQAGYGEHGREGLQELLDVPVVDITEAAASTAMYLGHRYSVVTTLDRAVPLIEDRLLLAGLDRRCASVRSSGMAVLELESDPERAVDAIVARGRGRGPRRSCRGDLPRLRRHGRARGESPGAHRRAGRGRRGRRRHCGGIPGPAGTVDLQGTDLRASAAEANDRVAAWLTHPI